MGMTDELAGIIRIAISINFASVSISIAIRVYLSKPEVRLIYFGPLLENTLPAGLTTPGHACSRASLK